MLLDINSTWVVVADTNSCRIYHYHGKPQLNLLKEINHPENKLRDIDLTSDKPGRYQAGNAGHGAYSQPSDPKEIKIDSFSREIADTLDHGRNTNAYERLIVISPPHINGLLFKHINKHVKDLVTQNIEKDLMHLPEHELLAFLQAHVC